MGARFIKNLFYDRRHPVSLVHFVTHRCNARCAFCFIDFDDPQTFKDELTLDELAQLIPTVGPHLRNVNLTGGEPFIRPDFQEIAELWLAKTPIQSCFITSNGSRPQVMERFAKTLSRRYPHQKLTFSLSVDGEAAHHDAIRRLPGLFEKCLESYGRLKALEPRIQVNLAITISPDNYQSAEALYDRLIEHHGVRSLSITLVRDEGVFALEPHLKPQLAQVYAHLSRRLRQDLQSGRLRGYDGKTLQGRMMNRKNRLSDAAVLATLEQDRYFSRCHAGALFGVLEADGQVRGCEILGDCLGQVRDYGLDFSKLWQGPAARSFYERIGETRCYCTYECAWTFNILGNWRYQPAMARAALPLKVGPSGQSEAFLFGADD